MTIRATCLTGGESVLIFPDNANRDPHWRLDAAGCTHCAEGGNADPDHHCGQAANACPREHDGPCWNPGPNPDRPEGCTVCRPVHIELIGGILVTGG